MYRDLKREHRLMDNLKRVKEVERVKKENYGQKRE